MIGERECLHCKKIFYPLKFWQKYCCAEHRIAAYYIRKAAENKLNTLDIKEGPTELQKADWASRAEQKREDDLSRHESKVLTTAKEMLSRPTPRSFLDEQYAPKKEDTDGDSTSGEEIPVEKEGK